MCLDLIDQVHWGNNVPLILVQRRALDSTLLKLNIVLANGLSPHLTIFLGYF